MTVEINHKPIEVTEGDTLDMVLQAAGIAGQGHAVAVNNRVVPRVQWSDFKVDDGQKITVIRAVCGG